MAFGGKGDGKKKDAGAKGKSHKVRMQLTYPQSSWDIRADLLPPRLAKKRKSKANAITMLKGLAVFLVVLVVVGFGLRASHAVDDLGLPFISNPEPTSIAIPSNTKGHTDPFARSTDAASRAAAAEQSHTNDVNKQQTGH
jgi:hypothetical protein